MQSGGKDFKRPEQKAERRNTIFFPHIKTDRDMFKEHFYK
jgi:hypothetical protein